MPRKQKVTIVEKEYGVKTTQFHKDDSSFTQNQIVRLNINLDDQKSSGSKLMDYNPDMTEPTGVLQDGLDDLYELPQSTSKKENKKEIEREKKYKEMMKEKNSQIENELQQKKTQFVTVKEEDMLQWVDMGHSQAYITQRNNDSVPCYWCLEKFNTISWPLVVGRNKQGKFKVRGRHCSPNCALANGMDSREMSETIPVSSLYSWMQSFVYKVTGNYDEIRPSPPRAMMQKFGGPMTPKMFSLECMMKNYNSYLTYPPLETSLPVWNRIKSDGSEQDEDEDELVLKRKTPFYDQKQSLDSIWRIKTIK